MVWQAQALNTELAEALLAQRSCVGALFSRLLAHLCRTTRQQEAFAALQHKARRDLGLEQLRRAAAEEAQASIEAQLAAHRSRSPSSLQFTDRCSHCFWPG
jgi:hypothetical protein